MAQNFIACDREQELLLPPSLREWLPADHLAWFVLDAVAEMDLTAFYASYRDDGWGRAAHDPAMMVALFVYAYAIGERSSRRIERRCRDDVAFRVITANCAPDHATIARFRVRHEAAIAELFGEVLALCSRSGLVKVGVVAVDGTKIAAAATHHATRSYEQIAQEILEDAARIDAAEDELYGDARGDELPEGLRTSGDRRKVLREAKQALDAERAAQAKKIPRGRSERLIECQRRLRQDWELERHVVSEHAAWHAAGIASDGSRRTAGARHNIKPYPLPSEPAGKINVTDPDSRNLKTTRGWVQGYNAQAVVSEGQIVIAAAASSTAVAKRPSSPCSGRSRPTAAPTGSFAAADQPSDPNGGCSRRPTTCSGTTDTSCEPPEARPDRQRSGLPANSRLDSAPAAQHFRADRPRTRRHHLSATPSVGSSSLGKLAAEWRCQADAKRAPGPTSPLAPSSARSSNEAPSSTHGHALALCPGAVEGWQCQVQEESQCARSVP